MNRKPLNGEKTHPLSATALSSLRDLRDDGPQPKLTFNAGIVDRLLREDLVEIVHLPSPYKTHKGRKIDYLQITAAGRAAAAQEAYTNG